MHGAAAALRGIAAYMCACQAQIITQEIGQQKIGCNITRDLLAIDGQANVHGILALNVHAALWALAC